MTVISASPQESLAGSVHSKRITSEEYEYCTTYDSIMDSYNGLQKTMVRLKLVQIWR